MSMVKQQKVIREMKEENLISFLLVSPFIEPKYFIKDCLGHMSIILEKQPQAVSQAQEGGEEESEEEEAAQEEEEGEVSFSV
uniref:Uncharacterized protein n=1 Tax=Chromera velia CCMP2878 TaxID=1169474 RepID=A0A0G4FGV7_9ALVE|eukprot:Cvel_3332.t1-p1 / transcript=Cvel_3332.t1 / gene=Cvel_3332 / organism=Chromera_velia_CCMP2878 / gene_product=hypothetical protein / transcript_product=hypothetical protein / location=Cvel_scaffold132:97412-97654(-) / protein_length=81 / sequence_SO=supercontig / SO=protein_coding / is_pseudo=false